MSRAPTAAARQQQADTPLGATAPATAELPKWQEGNYPTNQQIVLTTRDPAHDTAGRPARWFSRRVFKNGRWIPVLEWIDPATSQAIDPQPTHWRTDPTRW
jgi:hypothetical protein